MTGRTLPLAFAGSVRRGDFEVRAEFGVAAGEVLAILGPNGAGKSTLLHAIAGLVPLASGTISIGDRVLDDPSKGALVDTAERSVGFIFQDYRLFPHLTVAENVAFAARSRGLGRSAARRSSRPWLDRLELTELAERRPNQLSGGQRQRVAVARALASEPDMLLLDEPLAALDARTRVMVQRELRGQLVDFSGPVVLVTHDPLEALLLADRLLILEAGRVVQTGTPVQVTTRPATEYVARLVGLNLYEGTRQGDRVILAGGGILHVLSDDADGPVLVSLRPSAITVSPHHPDVTSARNCWPAQIRGLALLSDRVRLELAGTPDALADVTPAAVAELGLQAGDRVWLSCKATEIDVYRHPSGG